MWVTVGLLENALNGSKTSVGHCGSARKWLNWELDKCGSVWVHLIKPQIRVRQVWVTVGLLENALKWS